MQKVPCPELIATDRERECDEKLLKRARLIKDEGGGVNAGCWVSEISKADVGNIFNRSHRVWKLSNHFSQSRRQLHAHHPYFEQDD